MAKNSVLGDGTLNRDDLLSRAELVFAFFSDHRMTHFLMTEWMRDLEFYCRFVGPTHGDNFVRHRVSDLMLTLRAYETQMNEMIESTLLGVK